jgi:hypothetical protein
MAREEEEKLKDLIEKLRASFHPIAPVPDGTNITDFDFSTALSRTIDQLQKEATNASVIIPSKYGFSFEAQRLKVNFASNTLPSLAIQLGEVKAICDILFQAKVNNLDNIRRERLGTDDNSGPLTDYLDRKSTTNELAVISPYEVTFRCFTPELAAVITGFANSQNGLVIKGMNVEPAPQQPAEEQMLQPTFAPVYVPTTPNPAFEQRSAGDSAARFRQRYGIGPGGGSRYAPQPQQPPPMYAQPTAPPKSTAPQTVINEKQLKVTLTINVVKLRPTDGGDAQPPPAPAPDSTQAAETPPA